MSGLGAEASSALGLRDVVLGRIALESSCPVVPPAAVSTSGVPAVAPVEDAPCRLFVSWCVGSSVRLGC